MIAKTSKQRDLEPRRSAVSNAVKTQIQSRRSQYLAAAVVSGALAMPQQAPAQQSADQGLVIEEIVVTAAKREQSMQSVPIAMVALDSDALREQAITSFEDYAPGIVQCYMEKLRLPRICDRLYAWRRRRR